VLRSWVRFEPQIGLGLVGLGLVGLGP